jgi:hypothetical protein
VRLCRPSERVLDLLDNPVQTFVKEDGEAVTRPKGLGARGFYSSRLRGIIGVWNSRHACA